MTDEELNSIEAKAAHLVGLTIGPPNATRIAFDMAEVVAKVPELADDVRAARELLGASERKVSQLLLRAEMDRATIDSLVEQRGPSWESATIMINAARRNAEGTSGAEGSATLVAWETLHESISEVISERNALRAALRGVMDNLGVPQPGYPAPVAVAYEIASKALEGGDRG